MVFILLCIFGALTKPTFSEYLLLHKAKTSPHLIDYPSDVQCDVNSRLPSWAQISFYYPLTPIFDRPCLICQKIRRSTECYSNFIGQTSDHTVSEDNEDFTSQDVTFLEKYLQTHGFADLEAAQEGNEFEVIPEGYIKCSWLRTLEEKGIVFRCRIMTCKYGYTGLLSPINSKTVSYKDEQVILSEDHSKFIHSPIRNKTNVKCPFALRGIDYCSIGGHYNASLETFVCTTSQSLFQVDHGSNSKICELNNHVIFLTKTGEYISRQVVNPIIDAGSEPVSIDSNTLLDIRKSISSLSELNFINNVIKSDTGKQYFFNGCLRYKQSWNNWAFGYPQSCLAALNLISQSHYAGCKYMETGILAFETIPIQVDINNLVWKNQTQIAYYKDDQGKLFLIIPFVGIILNSILNSSQYSTPLPTIYPLQNGNYWSPNLNRIVFAHHQNDHLKILSSKELNSDYPSIKSLFTVPFSKNIFQDRWENHTADYKKEVIPILFPSFGTMINSVLWSIIIIGLIVLTLKVLSISIPSMVHSDKFSKLSYK